MTALLTRQTGGFGKERSSAAERNYTRWPAAAPKGGQLEKEVKAMAKWLSKRLQWLDRTPWSFTRLLRSGS